MASQDNYFVVRKGLGIGTAALYADGANKTVSIGKTVANYPLDVVGKIYSSDAIYAQNNAGVGTTSNYQQFDVIGSAYFSNRVGVGTTVPTQAFQVGAAATQSVVITGVGSVGVGTTTLGSYYRVDIVGNTSISGLVSSRDAYSGISTIGIATIGTENVGVSTVAIAFVGQERVGFSTILGADITTEIVGVSSIGDLKVIGITTTAKLDVGIGGTILKAAPFNAELVYKTDGITFEKTIRPLVGVGVTQPTRTLDVNGDLRVRGEVVDSQGNVGFGYSVLSASSNIPGRFLDAANMLLRNKEFIANEVVGFITSTDGPFGANGPNFDYGTAGISTGRAKCKRDIGYIIDAIAFDISKGGNSKSVGAGLSYYNGNTLQYLDDSPTPPSGFSAGYVKTATIVGFSSVYTLGRYVINNSLIPKSYQSGITSIKQFIDTELIADGNTNASPDGCANVVSAINTCVGIVTTIINGGPGSAPKINNPVTNLVWGPPGARIGNEWFVNKYGNDANSGASPGDAFLTIKKACSVAEPGDTVRVFAGLYVEDGPIQVPEKVAVVGEDLRRTLVTTRDQTDLYHIRRGCYIAQQSFVGPSNPNAMVSFPTRGNGYANGTEQDWQSPYIQNCTNFVPNSVGMRVDGNRAGGFKSMVLDAYTQYNQGGIGVSITNFGYAQLVSLFTICCDTAVFCDTGGVCDLNNSNASFGNYGLVSNGATPLQYVGIVTTNPTGDNIDKLVINVGVGASQEFKDTVDLLRLNKKFIATEAVGFLTSTSGPYGSYGPSFNYGGSVVGKSKCIRDGQIIIESICSDILTLGNGNCINAGLAYRDSASGSLTYLPETSPPPAGFSVGYVKSGELSLINYIVGICTYIAQNLNLPVSYQTGVGSITQIKDLSKTYSTQSKSFIQNRASAITDIINVGVGAAPSLILPKGQRPYDGQIAVIGQQYYFISQIIIDNPGSGYDQTIPVEVTVDLPSNSDYFIPAEAAIFETDINSNGTIGNISLIVSGTGYSQTPPNIIIAPPPGPGTTATAHAVMEKYFFNPISATTVDNGNTTVTFDQFITYPVSIGTTIYFYQSSKIIASSITFEYIGTGTTIVNAIPSKGAVPVTDNQVIATNGGKVPFTSTDQGGNFRISKGITINQNTGTISGQAFSKSLQAEVTPLIIALQQ
jgi:hypothetical protein